MSRIAFAVALSLAALPSVARAEAVGYVDTNRVYAEATEARRLLNEVREDGEKKKREIQSALDAARGAKAAEAEKMRQKAQELSDINQADFDRHNAETTNRLRARLAETLAKLKAERHLSQIAAGPAMLIVPGSDITDEAIRRWNAADAQGMAEELARTRAELAAAKAAKPEPPKK